LHDALVQHARQSSQGSNRRGGAARFWRIAIFAIAWSIAAASWAQSDAEIVAQGETLLRAGRTGRRFRASGQASTVSPADHRLARDRAPAVCDADCGISRARVADLHGPGRDREYA